MRLPVTVEVVGDTSTWVHLVDADGHVFAAVDSLELGEQLAGLLNHASDRPSRIPELKFVLSSDKKFYVSVNLNEVIRASLSI